MFVDIHSHILPGIDDGAVDYEDVRAMAEQAVQEGITHLIATPHYRKLNWFNKKDMIIELTQEVQAFLDQEQISLQVLPSQEIHVTDHLIDDLLDNQVLSLDPSGQYYLLEFPSRKLPSNASDLVSAVIEMGYTPVIAHVEKQQTLVDDMNILAEWVEKGALAQLTAKAISDPDESAICREFIDLDLVHFIASDAHNTAQRSFHIQEAFQTIQRDYSVEKAAYFAKNSIHLLKGEVIEAPLPQRKKKRKSFFSFPWFS
ncbi:hypothetical protein HZY86_01750 [Aerococcaceae bacterium DSM 111020]|nr:hypothetical protein [Aerococcaceae bacterium DSM 111020]